MAVCPSVYQSQSCIISKRIKKHRDIFLGPVVPSFFTLFRVRTDDHRRLPNKRLWRLVLVMGGATNFKPCMLISSPLPFLPIPFPTSYPILPSIPFPSLPVLGGGVPIPPTPSPPFPSLPLHLPPGVPPLNQLWGLGERYKLPQWDLGRSPSRQTIWCISGPNGPALVMGGATDLKVGCKTGFASGATEKNFFVPPLFQMCGYKQANISRGRFEYIEICCLVALINIGRTRPMVL